MITSLRKELLFEETERILKEVQTSSVEEEPKIQNIKETVEKSLAIQKTSEEEVLEIQNLEDKSEDEESIISSLAIVSSSVSHRLPDVSPNASSYQTCLGQFLCEGSDWSVTNESPPQRATSQERLEKILHFEKQNRQKTCERMEANSSCINSQSYPNSNDDSLC